MGRAQVYKVSELSRLKAPLTPPQIRSDQIRSSSSEADMVSTKVTITAITLVTLCVLTMQTSAGMCFVLFFAHFSHVFQRYASLSFFNSLIKLSLVFFSHSSSRMLSQIHEREIKI